MGGTHHCGRSRVVDKVKRRNRSGGKKKTWRVNRKRLEKRFSKKRKRGSRKKKLVPRCTVEQRSIEGGKKKGVGSGEWSFLFFFFIKKRWCYMVARKVKSDKRAGQAARRQKKRKRKRHAERPRCSTTKLECPSIAFSGIQE
jgi:hypothetical protein